MLWDEVHLLRPSKHVLRNGEGNWQLCLHLVDLWGQTILKTLTETEIMDLAGVAKTDDSVGQCSYGTHVPLRVHEDLIDYEHATG